MEYMQPFFSRTTRASSLPDKPDTNRSCVSSLSCSLVHPCILGREGDVLHRVRKKKSRWRAWNHAKERDPYPVWPLVRVRHDQSSTLLARRSKTGCVQPYYSVFHGCMCCLISRAETRRTLPVCKSDCGRNENAFRLSMEEYSA